MGREKGKDPQQGSAPDFPQAVQAQRFREAVQEKSGPQRQEKGQEQSGEKGIKSLFRLLPGEPGGNEPGQSGLNAGDTDGEGQKIQGHGQLINSDLFRTDGAGEEYFYRKTPAIRLMRPAAVRIRVPFSNPFLYSDTETSSGCCCE